MVQAPEEARGALDPGIRGRTLRQQRLATGIDHREFVVGAMGQSSTSSPFLLRGTQGRLRTPPFQLRRGAATTRWARKACSAGQASPDERFAAKCAKPERCCTSDQDGARSDFLDAPVRETSRSTAFARATCGHAFGNWLFQSRPTQGARHGHSTGGRSG